MVKAVSDLFENKEWIGEFFAPDHYENRFSGKLSYTPETGVLLDYSIIGLPGKGLSVPKDTDVLYGFLEDGSRCTLVGQFHPSIAIPLRGGHCVMGGRNAFSLLMIGNFVKSDTLFQGVTFTLLGMQAFFVRDGREDFVPFSNTPLLELKTAYGKLTVFNNATFGSLGDITSHIFTMNGEAMEELKTAFGQIKARHPDSHFELRKSALSHDVTIKFSIESSVPQIYKRVSQIANLFALLTCSPVYPASVEIFGKDRQGNLEILHVYWTMVIEKRAIELATKKRFHSFMPITNSNIDLSKVLEAWFAISDKYSVIVTGIQHEIGFRNEHSIHGEIVLWATQLESIKGQARKIKNEEKYQYPMDTYASDQVKKGLNQIFAKINKNSLGENISNLRNEIAHAGKQNDLLRVLSLQELANIDRYLQITIIAYILTKLGIPHHVIEDYQNKLTPKPE
jgi:hypothetical protein